MKGIILAGGAGTRLAPLTTAVSKQLLPIYDKPTIFYPLTTLFELLVRDILLISQTWQLPAYQQLLGDGLRFGARLQYAAQDVPKGIADAFNVAHTHGFLPEPHGSVCLILGDNLFHNLPTDNLFGSGHYGGAHVLLKEVRNPQAYGVAVRRTGYDGEVARIVEKPVEPPSRYAVPGLYCYDSTVFSKVQQLQPSARGELEITDLNNWYAAGRQLFGETLPPHVVWLDSGTPDTLLQASQYVQAVQARDGVLVGSPEIQAWENGWISGKQLREDADRTYHGNAYGRALLDLLERRSTAPLA